MKKETKTVGFDSTREVNYLARLDGLVRRDNLGQELKTQLAEDFGLLKFTLRYDFNENGKIVDTLSGEKVTNLTEMGGVDEETESIKKIEEGLKNDPEKTWIHFSPKNDDLGYPENCVDFWRRVDDEVVWNRMVVKNNVYEMNRIRQFLSGQEEIMNEMEMLSSPIGVNLKLVEIFPLFELCDKKNNHNVDYIERIVGKHLNEFEKVFGSGLFEDEKLIFRLYSACYDALKETKLEKKIWGRLELQDYMFGVMNQVRVESSFGCAATTRVGSFGEKIGYYISTEGKVIRGKIPEGYKECKECGCWYSGDKCPFC